MRYSALIKIFTGVCMLWCINVKAQIDSIPKHEKKETPEESFWKKVFIGGNMGLQFGKVTFIDVSPLVGYRITDKITAGVGVTYEYYHYRDNYYNIETNVYGGRVFGRYYFLKNVFAHGEYELLNLEAFDYIEPHRVNVTSVLAGAGYVQRLGPNASIVAMLLYNFTPSIYTPYNNPIIRLGVNFGL